MHPPGAVGVHCADDAVAEHGFHHVGDCGVSGQTEQMIGEPQNGRRDAGFAEGGFRVCLHLPDCSVVPEFAPDVFESAGSRDEQFVADNIMEIVQSGFK